MYKFLIIFLSCPRQKYPSCTIIIERLTMLAAIEQFLFSLQKLLALAIASITGLITTATCTEKCKVFFSVKIFLHIRCYTYYFWLLNIIYICPRNKLRVVPLLLLNNISWERNDDSNLRINKIFIIKYNKIIWSSSHMTISYAVF